MDRGQRVTPAQIIAARRAAQIAAMEGRPGEGLSADEARRAAKEVARRQGPRLRSRAPKDRPLVFSAHARSRMAQRGLSAADVYCLWQFGEPFPSGEDTAYCATDRAIRSARDASGRHGSRLGRLRGAAIIVDDRHRRLVTVIDDGPDTRFRRGR